MTYEEKMIERITDNWWILRYEGDEGRLAWFGQNQAEVVHKFAAWMRENRSRKIR